MGGHSLARSPKRPLWVAIVALVIGACSAPTPSASTHATTSPDSHHAVAYVTALNADGVGDVVPIDLATAKPGTPILVAPGYAINALAVSPDGQFAYATMVMTGTNTGGVATIDLTNNHVLSTMPIPMNAIPLDLAVTPDGNSIYVTGAVAAADGSVITTADAAALLMVVHFPVFTVVPVSGVANAVFPMSIAISPDGKTAYMTSLTTSFVIGQTAGSVDPFNLDTNGIEPGFPTPFDTYPRAIALTPNGKTLYVVADGTGSGGVVQPFDLTSQYNAREAEIATPSDGSTPYGIAITPDGKTAYVVNEVASGKGNVMPIDLSTNTPGIPIPIEGSPIAIAITPDGKTAYVTSRKISPNGSAIAGAVDAVWPIDLTTKTTLAPILVGSHPTAVVIRP